MGLGALEQLVARMAEHATLAEQFCSAVLAGDRDQAQKLLRRGRATRSSVFQANRAIRDLSLPGSQKARKLVEKMKCLTEVMKLGDEAATHWQSNLREPDDESYATETGVGHVVDAMLPVHWDLTRDLVLLVGSGGELLAKELVAAGQQRIVVFLEDGASCDGYPEQAVVVFVEDEMAMAIGGFAQPPPMHVVSRRLPDADFGPDRFEELVKSAVRAMEDVHYNRNTTRVFGERWVLQGIANIPSIAANPSVASLESAFRGLPMILIAPGPSLEKNIELIARQKGRAVLVAVSHALGALTRANVVPDMVLVLDAQELGYHFDGAPVQEIEALVAGVTVNPKVFELPAKRCFSFGTQSDLDGWIYRALGESLALSCGGSVATSAFSLGLHMGCDPIILTGMDLSFPGGRMYCGLGADGDAEVLMSDGDSQFVMRGWSEGYRQLETVSGATQSAPRRVLQVPAADGGTVPTSVVFDVFRRWFEQRAKELDGTVQLLNCTEGGALINGMSHLSLAAAIEQHVHQSIDVPAVLRRASASVDPDVRERQMLQGVREMLSTLAGCQSAANKCMRLAKRARKSQRFLAPLARAEAQLTEHLSSALFISLARQQELQAILDEGQEDATLAANLQVSMRFYQVVQEAHRIMHPALDGVAARLERAHQGAVSGTLSAGFGS